MIERERNLSAFAPLSLTNSRSRDTLAACFKRAVCCLLTALLLIAMPGRAGADEPTSIEQFNAQSRLWKQLVGTRLTLEGRCSGWSPERLLMTRCELVFEIADSVTVPRSKPKNVIVTGKLEERGSRILFVVTDLDTAPSDLDRLRIQRAQIDITNPDEWYALADRARQRAAFYRDEELDGEAIDLYRQGVQAEFRRMPADDSAGLVALAEKTRRFGLEERLKMEFLHEAVSRELRAAEAGKRPGLSTVMTHALDWLPGARIPLLEYNQEVQAQLATYLESRHDTYAAAGDDERRILERLLYIHTALARIEQDADEGGQNGFAVAERIEETLPELEELPEEYRLREIRWQTDNVGSAAREEMLILVDRLEDRDQAAEALDVKRKWLESRTEQYRRGGVSGKLELAKEYLDLLDDERAAVEIYRALHRSAESQQIAASRLQDLGYTYDGENWERGSAPEEDSELSMAIRNGSVREGMTQADVRAVLGAPESTLRFASRGQVVELWVYPGPGVSIHFAQRRTDQAQVAIEVFNLPVSTRERLDP